MSAENGFNGVETSAAPQVDGSLHVRRQRSMKFSLYPSRPRTLSSSGPPSPEPPLNSNGTPLPLPTRADSLPIQQRPATSYNTSSDLPRSSTSAVHSQQSPLHKRPSEASRLRALNNGYRSRSSDRSRTPERTKITENFSRPRRPSNKRSTDIARPSQYGGAALPLQGQDGEQTHKGPSDTRDRGFSTSSYQPTATSTIAPLRSSVSIPDYQAAESIYSRERNLNNSHYLYGRGMSRPASNNSAYRREPGPRPTGFENGEVRASFRSALTTTSSFMGTSGTERSSVMTKSSSATSIFGKDEGLSVDDAIGMYEVGFGDSGIEDDYGPRSPTANSEHRSILKVEEAMIDSLTAPESNLIIQDSPSIFRPVGFDSPGLQASPDSLNGALDGQATYFHSKSPTRPLTGQPTSQYDLTRDRYGFRKKTHYVTQAQFDAWNGPYSEYLSRRRKKWVALLKESGMAVDKPTSFPPKSVKVKRFVRKGIPPDWRGDAWFHYAGGPAMISKHYGVYDDLVQKAANGGVSETDDEIIERDLNRTFPDNIHFKPDPPPTEDGGLRDSQQPTTEHETPKLKSLRRVLQAFSIYNPKIGYCQSLNFLAGLLLLFMDEEKSFWILNVITRVYLPGTHDINLEGANVDLGVLMMSIEESMPAVWAKIGGDLDGSPVDSKVSMRLPPITLCTSAWFMSCFIGTLPIETTLRVWDCFFYEGSKTIFRIALAIFKVGEQEIKAVSDPMEIFQVVQTIPRRLIDASTLIDACYKRRNGFGHLSQGTIEERRAQRRAGYEEERARANGEVPLVRKQTIFKRKKARTIELV